MKKKSPLFFFVLAVTLFAACRTIALYNSGIFIRTSQLKARVLVVMDHATEPYEKYTVQVDSLMIEAHTLAAMNNAQEKNAESAGMWNGMLGTRTALLNGFFGLWKQKKELSQSYIDDKKEQVAEGFDKILKLEGAKLRN